MNERYTKDSLTIETVATLMGCKPNSGLVNQMNDLADAVPGFKSKTYGEMVHAVAAQLTAKFYKPEYELLDC